MNKGFKNLEKELKKLKAPSIALVETDTSYYYKTTAKTVGVLSDKEDGIYLTISKPYEEIDKFFKKNKIDTKKITYVDPISNLINSGLKDNKYCTYVPHPTNITEMNLALIKHLEKEKNKFLVVDSLILLTTYNSEERIARFLHHLSNANSKFNTNIVMLDVKGRENEKLTAVLSQFCDKVIQV